MIYFITESSSQRLHVGGKRLEEGRRTSRSREIPIIQVMTHWMSLADSVYKVRQVRVECRVMKPRFVSFKVDLMSTSGNIVEIEWAWL
jgi:hypothetical protein